MEEAAFSMVRHRQGRSSSAGELLYLPIKDTNTHVILPAAPPADLAVSPSRQAGQAAGSREPGAPGPSVFEDESECRLIGEMLKREVCVLHHWLDCALHFHANHNASSFLSILQDADYCANTVLYSNNDISNQPLTELPPAPSPASRLHRGSLQSSGEGTDAKDEVREPEGDRAAWDGDWRVLVDAAMAAHHTHAALRARDQVTRHEELLKSEEWRQKSEAAAGLPEASRKKGGGVDVPLLMRKDPNLLSVNSGAFLKVAKALLLNVNAANPPSGNPAGLTPAPGSGEASRGVPGSLGSTRRLGTPTPSGSGAKDGTRGPQVAYAGLQQEQGMLQRQSAAEVRGAEELFRLAAVHTPLHAAPLLGLASCAVYERRWEDALVYYCRLIAYSPVPPVEAACVSDPIMAKILASSGASDSPTAEAAHSGKGTAGFCPRRYGADLRFAAGMCFLRLSRHAEARRAFQRAASIDPTHQGALCGLALLLPAGGSQHEDQQQLLLAAHRCSPSDASVLLQLAARSLLGGDLRQAEGLLRAAQPPPFSLDLLAEQRYLNGWLLQLQGQTWRAVAELQRAQQLRPQHPATVFRLAQCLLLLGGVDRIKEAQALLESLLRMLPQNFEVHRLMGFALLAEAEQSGLWVEEVERGKETGKGGDGGKGDAGGAGLAACLRLYQRARQELKKAAEANEEDPATWMLLARCYEAMLVTAQDPRFHRPCLEAYEKILLIALKQQRISKGKVHKGQEQDGGEKSLSPSSHADQADSVEDDEASNTASVEEVLTGRVAMPEGLPLELLNNMAVLYLVDSRPQKAQLLLTRVLDQLSSASRESRGTRSAEKSGDTPGTDGKAAEGDQRIGDAQADGEKPSRTGSSSVSASGSDARGSAYAVASTLALSQLVAFNLSLVLTSIGAYSSASGYLKELCGSSASGTAGQKSLKTTLSVPSAWLLRARLAAERGDSLAAKRLCEAAKAAGVSALSASVPSAQRSGGASPDASLTLAEIFVGCGKIEAALASAMRVAGLKNRGGERDPFALTFVAVLQRLKAKRLLQQQSIEKANAALAESRYFFTLSLQASPSNCHAANGLAVLLAEENLTKAALAMLRHLLECSGCNPEMKATIHANCGLLLAALALTERPDIRLTEDVSKADHQKLHRAFRHLMIALEAAPMQKDLYLLMGRLLYDCMKFDAAVLLLQAAMQRWPNDLRIAYNLALCMDARVCSDLRMREKMQDPQVMRELLCMCQGIVQILTRLMYAKRSWGHLDPHTVKQVRHGLLPPSALESLERNAAPLDGRVAIAPEGAEELPSLQQLETLLMKSRDKILPHLKKSLPLIEQNWKEQQERREAQRRDQEELRRSALEKKHQKMLQEEAEQERQLEMAERLMWEAKEIAATLPLKREEEDAGAGGKKRGGKASAGEKRRGKSQEDRDRDFLDDDEEDEDHVEPDDEGGHREGGKRKKKKRQRTEEREGEVEDDDKLDRKKRRHREKEEKKKKKKLKKQKKEKKKRRHREDEEEPRSEGEAVERPDEGGEGEAAEGSQKVAEHETDYEAEIGEAGEEDVQREDSFSGPQDSGTAQEKGDAREATGDVEASQEADASPYREDLPPASEGEALPEEEEELRDGEYEVQDEEDVKSDEGKTKKAKKHKKDKKKRKREKEKKKKKHRHADGSDYDHDVEAANAEFEGNEADNYESDGEEHKKRRIIDEEE
ncbi:tetratricopeptide repeat-containing protein [Toxoplasma gondii MAS]|uniref:Tetratricopeptide repeat-containing protein n=1 Tax=Toxoplasma gondii MAS TaxID=943118 RepID=A0A086PQT9_TOXGO|nr:tetratricopeptide repeat-containing protein [Toxoplasma gondii MAS]